MEFMREDIAFSTIYFLIGYSVIPFLSIKFFKFYAWNLACCSSFYLAITNFLFECKVIEMVTALAPGLHE